MFLRLCFALLNPSVFPSDSSNRDFFGSTADCGSPPFGRRFLFRTASKMFSFRLLVFWRVFCRSASSSSASLSEIWPLALVCAGLDRRASFMMRRNDCLALITCPALLNLQRGMRASATPHFSTFPQSTKSPKPPIHIIMLRMPACGDSEKSSRLIRPMERRCSSAGSRLVVVK